MAAESAFDRQTREMAVDLLVQASAIASPGSAAVSANDCLKFDDTMIWRVRILHYCR